MHFRSCNLDFRPKSYGLYKVSASLSPKKRSSNIAYPINEHYSTNTCHESCLSPNINTSESITHVENFVHLYSKAEIKTLNRAKMCLVIKPKGFVEPSLPCRSPMRGGSRTCFSLYLPSPLPTPDFDFLSLISRPQSRMLVFVKLWR
jgi:hypothetical protein